MNKGQDQFIDYEKLYKQLEKKHKNLCLRIRGARDLVDIQFEMQGLGDMIFSSPPAPCDFKFASAKLEDIANWLEMQMFAYEYLHEIGETQKDEKCFEEQTPAYVSNKDHVKEQYDHHMRNYEEILKYKKYKKEIN